MVLYDFLSGATALAFWTFTINWLGLALTPVPEPATWAMMVLGFGFVGFGMRRARTPAVSYA